ncbi:ATP-binding protein [[Brevibacterium] frigoritolerans]|nr:ATP-binding protein [Peribacillus frigoritolerans]
MSDEQQQLSFLDVIGKRTRKTNEDEAIEKTMDPERENMDCSYHICDGSGMIRTKNENGAPYVEFCKCHEDLVLAQKLKNAKISLDFLNRDFDFDDGKTKAYILKPKLVVEELKIKKKNQTKQEALLEEDPNNYLKRNFTIKEDARIPGEIFKSFAEKNFEKFTKHQKPGNLLLFGDPGNGKTSFACLIGSYFLKMNKKVYFSTAEDFLNAIYNKRIDPMQIAGEYDLLILDEFFNEYHTDTQWAKKKLKEIMKVRDENKLMTICTSNGNPKEFSLLYGESIMSLLKGTFFNFYLERDGDGRVENMHNMFDDFGF